MYFLDVRIIIEVLLFNGEVLFVVIVFFFENIVCNVFNFFNVLFLWIVLLLDNMFLVEILIGMIFLENMLVLIVWVVFNWDVKV